MKRNRHTGQVKANLKKHRESINEVARGCKWRPNTSVRYKTRTVKELRAHDKRMKRDKITAHNVSSFTILSVAIWRAVSNEPAVMYPRVFGQNVVEYNCIYISSPVTNTAIYRVTDTHALRYKFQKMCRNTGRLHSSKSFKQRLSLEILAAI